MELDGGSEGGAQTSRRLRQLARVMILAATGIAFASYMYGHPELMDQLWVLRPTALASLLGLYVVWFAALALVVHATLRLCSCPLPTVELLVLCAWSTLVNFFVPGQGGLALRGVYLKQRHGLPMGRYVIASLWHYATFALLSAAAMLAPTRPWWQTMLGVLSVGIGSAVLVGWYQQRKTGRHGSIVPDAADLAFLAGATLTQVFVQVAVFGYELQLVEPAVTLQQATTYTGATNFAQFVALTPGAIGIRESFALLSQQLHLIDTATIIASSLIDRAAFLVLLAVLALVSLVPIPETTPVDDEPG